MVYDSLLLACGGGIHGAANKSPQYTGSASLIIGLGGTGVAALSQLKGKVREQLIPDDEKDPNKYDGIQFLAIDSDETDCQRQKGNRRLSTTEFFSIRNPALKAILADKDPVKNDPFFNWMEIDNIATQLDVEGAGGVRQIGRYLLLNKVQELKTLIESKANTAMKNRGVSQLDVYILAGISGGTGSGCFLDTCYIVRQIAENKKWNAKIMGYFFLPDVVTSKSEVARVESAREYNESNGYAAMKELDYLMSLPTAHDRFVQDYCAGLRVDTQDPPVDMCHLISSIKADGTPLPNGFDYAINVAADYVMSYLADVDLGGENADESSMTMRGHAANIAKGVSMLKKDFGANLSYHIVGACNAEIPMTQINTYLACGFYEKFMKAAGAGTVVVTRDAVRKFAEGQRITADEVSFALEKDCPAFELPDEDPAILQRLGQPVKGKLHENWAKTANDWHDNCLGRMTGNENGLLVSLDNYDYNRVNVDSLIGRVFRKLLDLAKDPEFGPYYAAQILHNGAYSLDSAIDDAIKTAEEKLDTQRLYSKGSGEDLEKAKESFYKSGALSRKNAYKTYKSRIAIYYDNLYQITKWEQTAEALRRFKKQVTDLNDKFFKPLVELLNNLKETFEENRTYLSLPAAKGVSEYTWQIFTFDEIKNQLDVRIEKLTAKELIVDFVEGLLKDPGLWLDGEADQIAMMIRRQMTELFETESKRSLQDYLFERYPAAGEDPKKLAEIVEKEIIKEVIDSSVPMFHCDTTFNLANTFMTSSLSVPRSASAVCQAAEDYKEHSQAEHFTVRKTGLGGRIFSLRLYSGVPLHAYLEIGQLKATYDSLANTAAAAGIHLYSNTGRKDAKGNVAVDWAAFLPTPLPYSKNPDLVPEGAGLEELYNDAVAAGVIAGKEVVVSTDGTENAEDAQNTAERKKWILHKTPDYASKKYTLESFMVDGRFSMPAYDEAFGETEQRIKTLYDACEEIVLRNDGNSNKGEDVVSRVRKDYFLHYPRLQIIARRELKKRQTMKDDLKTLQEIKTAYEQYEAELDRYVDILFYRLLSCRDNMDSEEYGKIHKIFATYKDQFGEDRTFDFSVCCEEMTYAENYPLYQGFLTYRSLAPDAVPREELDEKVAAEKQRTGRFEDLMIPAILEQVWNGKAIDALKKEISLLSVAEADEILRFYEGLRSRVNKRKKASNKWPTAEDIKKFLEGGDEPVLPNEDGDPVPPEPVPQRTRWWVKDPATGKTMRVYRERGPLKAYDEATKSWHKVHSGMKVSTADNKAWIPLKDDPFFAEVQ